MTCPRCNQAISRAGADYCAHCGQKLPQKATEVAPAFVAGGVDVCQITILLCCQARALAALNRLIPTRQSLERVLRVARARGDDLGLRVLGPCLAYLQETERDLRDRAWRAEQAVNKHDAETVTNIRQWLADGTALEESERQVLSR